MSYFEFLSFSALEDADSLEGLGQDCVERDIDQGAYPMYQDPQLMGPGWLNYHRLLRQVKETFDPYGLSNPPRPLHLLSEEEQ